MGGYQDPPPWFTSGFPQKSFGHRLEGPDDGPRRLVEREERAPRARQQALGGHQHALPHHRGLDVDLVARRDTQVGGPQLGTVVGVVGDDGGRAGEPEDLAPSHRHARGTELRERPLDVPTGRPVGEPERVDAAVERPHVHRAVDHQGVRSQVPERSVTGHLVLPHPLEVVDGRGIEARVGHGARVAVIAVRQRPSVGGVGDLGRRLGTTGSGSGRRIPAVGNDGRDQRPDQREHQRDTETRRATTAPVGTWVPHVGEGSCARCPPTPPGRGLCDPT
ncbi:MAG: hypothetical protein U5R31_13640 [Acidimicrobiia bacterium]|nr:hypothetical protein [Acidimicrobiia bacterium]